MMFSRQVIALEKRLRKCRNVITLGVKPNWDDYPDQAKAMMMAAKTIYYPSAFYAELFDTAGVGTFPSYHTYKIVQYKVKQSALFKLLDVAHPQTRVFFGRRQQKRITDLFQYPFIAKVARGSALGRGVYRIDNEEQLERYLVDNHVAYIQEYLPVRRDIRVVIIGDEIAHAYWRVAPEGDFRCNLSAGGGIDPSPVPDEAIALALQTARKCRWNDVGIDVIIHKQRPLVIEANMKYGKQGFRAAGIDYTAMMEKLIDDGRI